MKTGGLADVVGALPKALAGHGVEARILLPVYPAMRSLIAGKSGNAVAVPVAKSARVYNVEHAGLDLLLLDAPALFDREGTLYLGPDGRDWPDNHLRYGALCQVAARIAEGAAGSWRPDIVHLHDWQAGLVPLYLKEGGKRPPSLFTIHNIAFQGLFPRSAITELGLPEQGFSVDGYEYWGKVSLLKAGLVFSDAVSTVSPTYARELLTPEFGMGMDGILRSRPNGVDGILNGIDADLWNPETDTEIASNYTVMSFKRKSQNRKALEARFGIEPRGNAPLFCVISRLTTQKGMDLLIDCLDRLVEEDARLIVLGSGETEIESALLDASRRNAGKVGFVTGYDEALSHQMQAGSDAIVVPSRFEPCGLTQLYGLRYGTLPVVARTGGLADTVIDANHAALTAGCATGFVFAPGSRLALGEAIERACTVFREKSLWKSMIRGAMRHPVGWDGSALSYKNLYEKLVSSRQ